MKTAVTSVKFFNPGLDYKKRKREIKGEINRILSAGDLILRGDVEQFEKNLAEFVGVKHAIALNSGTDALYLALKVLDIGPNSRVSVPSHTFVATAQVVAQLGAEPVLYDMDEVGASNVDVHMVAHITGSTEKIPDIGIPIIEDACQALGAVKNPTTAMQCWSFYPAKILGAYGDGGAVTTNDDIYAEELRELRNHYKKDYSKWGINSRMDNLQAAILNVKFKDLNETLAKRENCAKQYIKAFSDLDFKGKVSFPLKHEQEWRVWQDFVLDCHEKRDELYEFLKTKGVETMKNEYPFPIQKCPNSLAYEARTLRLPCNEHLKKSEIKYVIDCVKEFYAQE